MHLGNPYIKYSLLKPLRRDYLSSVNRNSMLASGKDPYSILCVFLYLKQTLEEIETGTPIQVLLFMARSF